MADTNYRFVYVDIGSYWKDCDSKIFKRSTLWTSIQTNMLELHSERHLSGTEGPDVPHFLLGDEGFALNTNIHPPFGGSNLSVKTECTIIACAEHEGTWNVLLEFWTINGEFSSDRLMSVLTLQRGRIKLFGAPRQWKHFRPLFQTEFLSGGGRCYPPRLSQTPRLPVPRQK